MPTIAKHCAKCQTYNKTQIHNNISLICHKCCQKWGEVQNQNDVLKVCPCCDCRQFYLVKDFNQMLGCLVMLIGIVLSPFTYYLSLPVFALIDWILYKRYPMIVACYKCGAEFRGLEHPKHLKPFMHHIGLKYDKFR